MVIGRAGRIIAAGAALSLAAVLALHPAGARAQDPVGLERLGERELLGGLGQRREVPVEARVEDAVAAAELRRQEVNAEIARAIAQARRRFELRSLERRGTLDDLEDYRYSRLRALDREERAEELALRPAPQRRASSRERASEVRRELDRTAARRELDLRLQEADSRIRQRLAADIRNGRIDPALVRDGRIPGAR